jgi:hypothetical protein
MRRVILTSSLLVITSPNEQDPSPTVLDAILLAEIQGIRTLLGKGPDATPAHNRWWHPFRCHQRRDSTSHGDQGSCDDTASHRRSWGASSSFSGFGASDDWAAALPRVGGGARFADTVEIRSRHGTRRSCRAAPHRRGLRRRPVLREGRAYIQN